MYQRTPEGEARIVIDEMLDTTPLRECQIEAVTPLERTLAANRPRALLKMAAGSGMTFAAT